MLRFTDSKTGHSAFAISAALIVITVLSRLPYADRILYNMDSVHFAIALDRYDVALHQPHPPGYFLYVMMGRLVRLVTGDANTALIAISILFSGLSVSLVYAFSRRLYGMRAGIAAALIALTSPLLWFHGIVALSYAAECFLSILIAWLCYRLINGEERLVWATAILLGLAGGVRQTTIIFLLPLWLYSIRDIGARKFSLAMLVCALSFASWFLPMLHITGGYERYRAASDALVSRAVWNGITFHGMLNNLRIQIFWVVWGLLAALVPAVINVINRMREEKSPRVTRPDVTFFILWLAPSLLFYVLIMSKEQNPGYSLVYMPALYILAGRTAELEAAKLADKFHSLVSSGRTALTLMLAAILAVNTLAFFMLDFIYSYRGVMKSTGLTTTYLDGLKANFSPEDTVVIGWEHIFVSYRHVAYYLPQYLVYYIPRLMGPNGGYYLSCRGRATEAVREIAIPEGTKFIVYFVPNTKGVSEKTTGLGAAALQLSGGYRMMYFRYDTLMASGLPIDKALLGLGYDEDI